MDLPVTETRVLTTEEVIGYGQGDLYRGAPDSGLAGGPAVSPQFGAATHQ